MRIKIKARDLAQYPSETFEFRTNLLAVTEWERETNRRFGDGSPIGFTELAWFSWFMLKLAGKTHAPTVLEFVRENPDADLEIIAEETPKNPTNGAPTDDN